MIEFSFTERDREVLTKAFAAAAKVSVPPNLERMAQVLRDAGWNVEPPNEGENP